MHTIVLPEQDVDALVDVACSAASRDLTQEEWAQYFPGEDYRATCDARPNVEP